MSTPQPKYDLRKCRRIEIIDLFKIHHGYKSLGRALTYAYAVIEDGEPVAAYVWSPPPRGAALAVCPEAPSGVLALSRMVAVPRDSRKLNHVSKPLRRQMRVLVDRTRYPVLITYSDSSLGHTGHVYKCSGWKPTSVSRVPYYVNSAGERRSRYRNGRTTTENLQRGGTTTLQRWEHWACASGGADQWMAVHGWVREPIPGKFWKSGNPAHRYVRR